MNKEKQNILENVGYDFDKAKKIFDWVNDDESNDKATDNIPIVSIAEKDGEKGVRLHAADVDIFIEANDLDDGKGFTWDKAMKRLEEVGKTTFNKHEGYLITAFIDEINEKLREIGGKEIEGYYWSSAEYSQTLAWYVNFSNGSVGNTYKYYSYVVRPVAALN